MCDTTSVQPCSFFVVSAISTPSETSLRCAAVALGSPRVTSTAGSNVASVHPSLIAFILVAFHRVQFCHRGYGKFDHRFHVKARECQPVPTPGDAVVRRVECANVDEENAVRESHDEE